jgi:phosphatidylinositol alpha-1,6-mannosyltransferase
VLTVARLEPEDRYKGVDTLIQIWPALLDAQPHAELVIVGDGRDRGWLQRCASSGGVGERIRFVGRVDDASLRALYRTAEVFALPTRSRVGVGAAGEGFGLVFLEAAAAGLPILAGRTAAVPEVIEDEETGLLVDPEDRRAVAHAVDRLLGDQELRAHLGRAARTSVLRRFTYESFGDRIDGLLGGLLNQGHAR